MQSDKGACLLLLQCDSTKALSESQNTFRRLAKMPNATKAALPPALGLDDKLAVAVHAVELAFAKLPDMLTHESPVKEPMRVPVPEQSPVVYMWAVTAAPSHWYLRDSVSPSCKLRAGPAAQTIYIAGLDNPRYMRI